MKYIIPFIAVFFLTSISNAQTLDPKGLWLTENKRAAIEISDCQGRLCGHIAWIIKGGMTKDSKNPDPTKRERSMCGMPILWNFKQNANNPNAWEDGRIYKADEGDIYSANISVIDANKLFLRGYVGIPLLGKTQYWTRVSKKDYPACKQ